MDSARAWVVLSAAFLSMFTVFGVAYSFGEFFGPMAKEFGTDRAQTALFFAITTFAYFTLGIFSGRIADRIGPRPVLLFGAAAMTTGLYATSHVSSLELGYLTYGLGVGLGVACGYVPMVAAVGGWFEARRTLALGLAVSGIGFGTLVMVPITERLIDAKGWRWTYRTLSITTGALLLVAAIGAFRPPSSAETPRPIRDALRGRTDFAYLWISSFFISISLFTPFVFMADYMDSKSIDGSAGLLLGVIGMASIAGRLGFGATAGRLGIVALYRLSFVVLGASFIIWLMAGTSYTMLVIYALVIGVSYGGFIALSPAVVAELFGTVGLGGILGAIYTAAGVGGLVGPPLMGWIIDQHGHSAAHWTALASGAIASLLLIGVRTPPPTSPA